VANLVLNIGSIVTFVGVVTVLSAFVAQRVSKRLSVCLVIAGTVGMVMGLARTWRDEQAGKRACIEAGGEPWERRCFRKGSRLEVR